MIKTMFRVKNDRHLVTAIGLLALYAVGTSAYIVTLSPKLSFLGNKQQEALTRAIELEYRLREVAGLTAEEDVFSVELKSGSSNPSMTYAYVKRTSNAYPFATIENVYLEHYHPAELKGESLFVIRRVPDHSSEHGIMDELWRYSITGKSERLYTQLGLDFRASPTGDLLAISEPSKLAIIRPETGEERNLRWPELAGEFEDNLQSLSREYDTPPTVFLEGWSQNGTTFWGTLGWTGSPTIFFRINPVTGAVKAYDASALEKSGEFVLHPTTGRVAYSTYPLMFDVDSQSVFESTGEEVELRMLDLLRNTDTLIAQSKARSFHPLWIDGSTIEYDDPAGGFQRLIRKID